MLICFALAENSRAQSPPPSPQIKAASNSLCSGAKTTVTATDFTDQSNITWTIAPSTVTISASPAVKAIVSAPVNTASAGTLVGIATVTATSGTQHATASITLAGQCTVDHRGIFEASFYLGAAIDTFAGDETLNFLNFQDSSNLHARAVGGIDFAYRLVGDQHRSIPSRLFTRVNDLWVFGGTVHGVRSADVPCQPQTGQTNLLICGNKLVPSPTAGQDFVFILRNATSLEGYTGLRWEFLGLQQGSSSPANLYLKTQVGFIDVAGQKGHAKAEHHIGLGAIATKGDFQDSYLEVGWGRSDIFQANHGRWKIDGYLERKLFKILNKDISLFAQISVDTHLGHGSDAVQSYIGFTYDLTQLLGK